MYAKDERVFKGSSSSSMFNAKSTVASGLVAQGQQLHISSRREKSSIWTECKQWWASWDPVGAAVESHCTPGDFTESRSRVGTTGLEHDVTWAARLAMPEGEEGTRQQGCSKFYNSVQTMCRTEPVLILPSDGAARLSGLSAWCLETGGVGVGCLLFLCVLLVSSPSQYVG